MMTQERIRQLKKDQLGQLNAYRNYLYTHPSLRFLFFELTLQCNENCFHCGSRCHGGRRDTLPKEYFLGVLDDVKDNLDSSWVQLCITGGEPLLYPEFFPLMEGAKERGFRWGMTSNATLISKEVARGLRETGMETISVSIDGLQPTHDILRGRAHAWKDAMEGIDHLIETGGFSHIQVTTVVNHDNLHELDALYEIFRKIDIDSWRIIGLEPIGRALEHPKKMLTGEDQAYMFSFIREKREEQMPVTYGCSHYLGLDLEREVRDWYFLCNAGIYSASVTAEGEICACLDIERRPELIQGNIKEDRFSDVWKNRFQIYRKRLSSSCRECRECPAEEYCAGGSFHSWDFDENRQRVCMKDLLAGLSDY